MSTEEAVLLFPSPEAFRSWLAAHHANHSGFWMRVAKKGSALRSVTYAEALDEALCYGWIDGQKKTYDADAWLQRFCPRGPRSGWSKVNVDHVERLTREGRMQPAGLAAVAAAQADGRWDRAYLPSSEAKVPDDFLDAVKRLPRAAETFEKLSKSSRYSIYYHLATAKKPETRARRFAAFLDALERGEKPGGPLSPEK